MLNGFINIDKSEGIGSTEVVSALKKLLFPRFGRMKIGHTGTLDPLASGVLPIALGEATKAIPYMEPTLKIYIFAIKFGVSTTTDDRAGEVVETSTKIPSVREIEEVLPKFMGAISQIPPRFSAIKINGQRAYDLARAGAEFDIKPRANFIHLLRLIEQVAMDEFKFEVQAERGFYVRSLARDMAAALGTAGHASLIRRTASGPFTLESAISLDNIAKMLQNSAQLDAREFVLDICLVLDGIPAIGIDESQQARLKHGQTLETSLSDGLYRALFQDRLVCIAKAANGVLKPERAFNI
ncbi:MAG: tRNA pseudouridine(55) synthase TruB [Rickettsiales bacterium]|jgi:tRNA pseudouridine55 synthase|nr:tRNA pseudouridine(55) synthase TruB [Rickettsiales bacterium]